MYLFWIIFSCTQIYSAPLKAKQSKRLHWTFPFTSNKASRPLQLFLDLWLETWLKENIRFVLFIFQFHANGKQNPNLTQHIGWRWNRKRDLPAELSDNACRLSFTAFYHEVERRRRKSSMLWKANGKEASWDRSGVKFHRISYHWACWKEGYNDEIISLNILSISLWDNKLGWGKRLQFFIGAFNRLTLDWDSRGSWRHNSMFQLHRWST